MNRAQTAAIVLLLASAATAYEEASNAVPEEVRPAVSVSSATEADGPGVRDALKALLAWALGRDRPIEPERST